MELFRNSDTKRAGTVFVMAACIVLFFLLITPEEGAQLAAPLFKNGNFYSILGMAMLIILFTAIAGVLGWNLNPTLTTQVDKVVTIETMKNGEHELCDKHKSSPSTLEECCSAITDASDCLAHSHCGWLQTHMPLSTDQAHTGVTRLHSECKAVTENGGLHFKSEIDGIASELTTKTSMLEKEGESAVSGGINKVEHMLEEF